MNDPNRALKWVLITVLVALSFIILYPPSEKLKGGIDLVGGSSLLFEIDTTGLSKASQRNLAARVMEVLKQRVDPGGQMNLEWRPIGNTRLEIRMPRPPQHVLERRETYNKAIDALAQRGIDRREIERALSASDQDRDRQLAELVRGISERTALLTNLVEADTLKRTARESGVEQDIESTTKAFDEAMEAVLATSLPVLRFKDVLGLPPGDTRREEIAKIRAEFPSYDSELEDPESGEKVKAFSVVLEAYDQWSKDKTNLEDPADLKRLLRGAGVLEFMILADRDPGSPTMIKAERDPRLREEISKYTDQLKKYGPRPRAGEHFRWYEIKKIVNFLRLDDESQWEQRKDTSQQITAKYAGSYYVLVHNDPEYKMSGKGKTKGGKWKLIYALTDRDPQTGGNIVVFGLDARGATFFGELTGANIERQLAIVLDDKVMSHATIRTRITERCQISGDFSQEDVLYLVRTLEAGALPARLKETPLAEKTIGPSLGETNRTDGMRAAIWGGIVVAIFVLIYYGFAAGGLANVALALNLLFVLSAMALMQATFTLPGIAGLILTVGMAIDANVLIFERFREERDRGIVFKKALNAGYDKATSTIVDANLTTLITCVILGMVSSEEVKGFAIVLGLGIATSMFTALFVTRLVFNTLVSKGMLSDLRMFRLIRKPSVDWISLRARFWPVSLVLVVAGAGLFAIESTADPEAIYDIEFLGGTSVQVDLKPDTSFGDDGRGLDEQIKDVVTALELPGGLSAAAWLVHASDFLKEDNPNLDIGQAGPSEYTLASKDQSAGGRTFTGEQLAALMRHVLKDVLERDGVRVEGRKAIFTVQVGKMASMDEFRKAVSEAQKGAARAAENLRKARVQEVGELAAGGMEGHQGHSFEVITVETNRDLVQAATLAALGDKLELQQAVGYSVVEDEAVTMDKYFIVQEEQSELSEVLGRVDAQYSVDEFKGGVVVQFALDQDETPMTEDDLKKRLREVRLRSEYEQYSMRKSAVFPLGTPEVLSNDRRGYREFAVVAVDQNLRYEDDPIRWAMEVADVELALVEGALASEKSLSKVVQFAPQIAGQTRQNTVFAVVLALVAIVVYVWLRFGTMQYGLAAIVALVHDVSITLGMVTLSHFIYDSFVGTALGLSDFKIDLPMIAAALTVIGYSLNDTIVVFDRIRENRGRLGTLSAAVINNSINQTLSRTLLTSITTFLVVFVMFIWGGEGIKGFSYALLVGVLIGTYSSIGVATPLLFKPRLLNAVSFCIGTLGMIGIILTFVENGTWELILIAVIVVIALVWGVRVDRRTALTSKPARDG